MAYSARGSRGSRDTRGGSRTSGGRSGGGSGGGPPKSNPMPMVLAGVALIGVIALFFVFKKKDPPKATPLPPPIDTTTTKPKPKPEGPKPIVKGPLPALPADIITRARNLMPSMQEAGGKAKTLYDEALKAKDAGDDATWQSKMEEGREILAEARQSWNDIEEEVMSFAKDKVPAGWSNADEVVGALFDANLKTEQGIISKHIDTPMQKMMKTSRGS